MIEIRFVIHMICGTTMRDLLSGESDMLQAALIVNSRVSDTPSIEEEECWVEFWV